MRLSDALVPGSDGTVVQDSSGRYVDLEVANIDGVPTVVRSRARGGFNAEGEAGVTVETTYSGGVAVDTDIKINGNPIPFEFSDIGGALGQQLGYRIAGNNAVLGIATSAVLQTLGDNLGDALDGLIGNQSATKATKDAFATFGPELLTNLKSAGIGALSSFLTAELIDVIGVGGFAGDLLNTGAGAVIGQVVTNLAGGFAPFANLGAIELIGSIEGAIGSFLGNKLANEVLSFGSIGGQIGAAVGSSLALIAGASLIGGPLGLIGAAVFAFVGNLIGGVIGSLFGGTPRSGADAVWDESEGRFVVANAYSRKGGSEETAEALASSVAETFNLVLEATGGRLQNPGDITTGNYGMRKKDFVYRATSTRDRNAISYSVSSKQEDGFAKLTGYGIYQGLTDPDFQIIGGSNYVKRAVYASFGPDSGQSATNFDSSVLLGNIASAQAYETYLANSAVIGAIVSAESDSVFAIETAINLARAVELGLTKRHRADWFGGFTALFEEADANVANVEFGFDYDPFSDQISRTLGVGDFVLGDSIDVAGQTTIEGTAGADTITLTHVTHNTEGFEVAGGAGRIADTTGFTINGEAADGSAVSIDVAATIDAGDGDDVVHGGDLGNNIFGGAGDDTLYGGKLDDWILGGDGNDVLDAAAQGASTLGGDGNYLNGGAGDDLIQGREGSDWLEGGDGVDQISGAGGDDILTGGAGDGDLLYGGAGDDSYLLRIGDGADIADDSGTNVVARSVNHNLYLTALSGAGFIQGIENAYDDAIDYVNNFGTAGYVQARFAGLANGTIARDWTGYFTPGVSTTGSGGTGLGGGEDSIVLGQGIGIGDVRLMRSEDAGGNATDDLIIQIMGVDANGDTNPTGDQMTLTDWFVDPFKRIEWLKFADGNEIRIGDITSFVAGTNGNDTLIGTLGNDFVYGGDGNDQLFLLAGDDIGSGGSGLDYIAGDSGDDLIIGGSGDDALSGGAGVDVLSGDGGNDDLYGGAGNDIISGGRGDDQLVGGEGDDIFKYSRGDGADVIFDDFAGTWETVWQRTGSGNGGWASGYTPQANGEITDASGNIIRANLGTAQDPQFQWVGRWDYDSENETLTRLVTTAGSAVADNDGTASWRWDPATGEYTSGSSLGDTIEFAPGINIQDIVLRENGDDLVLHISRDGGSSGVVAESGDSITLKDWSLAVNNIERLAFFSTGELDLTATNIVAGSDGDDTLAGTSGADWITGGTGEDDISGNSGDDIISGNGGIDTIRGGAGDDVLYGGAGDDILIGGAGEDILIGGAGSDWASYEDVSSGLTVSLAFSGQSTGEASGDIYSSIENLRGGSGDDRLIGDAGENILEGGKGNDTLEGGEGDDTYVWNAVSSSNHDGATTIREGQANFVEIVDANGNLASGYVADIGETIYADETIDAYLVSISISGPSTGEVYYAFWDISAPVPASITNWPASGWSSGQLTGNGLQRVVDSLATTSDAGLDTLELGEGITLADLTFIESGNDLIIQYRGSSASQITIQNQNSVGGKVEFLQFYDGLSVNLANLLINASAPTGSDTDDFIVVTQGGSNRAARGGDDVLFGSSGIDILRGDAGDDVIEGGAGADDLRGGSNSANDGTNPNWGDTVRYTSSKGAQVQVDFRKQATGEVQIGGDAEGDILTGFENYVGSDFVRDNFYGDDNDNRIFGLGGGDVLRGLGGDDVISGGDGNDFLYGGEGNDNLVGGAGNDYFQGNNGDDIIVGGEGDDRLYGQNGNDRLIGGNGDDYILFGGAGDDVIDGGAGDDIIHGDANNDTLIGGAGDDSIDGGTGDDVFVFGANDGVDTLTDTSGINTIIFGDGVTRDKLWITKQGNDLRLAVIGGDTVATFKDFYTGTGKLEKIQTADGTLFVNDSNVKEMIRQMSGGFAAGSNLVDLSAWPGQNDIVPTDGVAINGWSTSYIGETEWALTEGPDGNQINSLYGGQEDGGGAGGGAYSQSFEIDGSKAYEFTYYFKNDEEAVHNIYFGLSGNVVKRVSNGAVDSNPYFVALTSSTQNANFDADRWYKVVGYVLPEGSANQSNSSIGGIYDVATGEKVYDTADFRWNEARTSNNSVTRFFNYYGTENVYNTHFYKPQVREIGIAAAPDILPDWFADRLDQYWESGETAAPRAPSEVQTIDVINYGANAVNLDGWPDIPDTGRGENLVLDDGWPMDIDNPPTGDAVIDGWQNNSGYANESVWTSVTGPYAQQVVSMNTGQEDSSVNGGGNFTNNFDIDKGKTYEFTYYFKADELSKHRIYFGLGGTNVKNGSNGAVNGNPYFTYDYPNAASGIEVGKWYKAVGYVLPEGSENQPTGTYGGIYDTETGEKVRDIASFRWNEGQTDTSIYSRFFNYYNPTNVGKFTHFYKPEVRSVEASAILTGETPLDIQTDALFIQAPNIEGWQNIGWATSDGEARWVEVVGPQGDTIRALEAGQFDASANGGGNYTNEVQIDRTKAYKYTQYVRKSDIDKHYLYAGLATNTDAKEYLHSGNPSAGGYFVSMSNTSTASIFNEDEWYKIVGYVLPAGTPTATHGTYGGIYDSSGNKVANTYAFRWSSSVQNVTARSRFFTYYDTNNHGWSTQFAEPSLTIVGDSVADVVADNADPLGLTENERNTDSSVLINAALGVADHDNDISGYELNPDGAPLQGTVEIVNAATGQIRYTPNVDATGTDSFSVLVRDANDNVTAIPINIELSVPGINHAPDVPSNGFVIEVDENSATGAIAGTLSAIDPDGDSGIDYRFVGSLVTLVAGKYATYSNDGMFRMERDTGNVILNEGTLDFEAGTKSFNYDILVSDRNSGTDSRTAATTLTIDVDDVNELHALQSVSLDVNYYTKALGPLIPMPDANGFAINLRDTMLIDPENANTEWAITQVKLNGTVLATHPWTVNADGSLHLDGAIIANETYELTIEADDSGLAGSAVSAILTLNVGPDDGFVANPAIATFDWTGFNWSGIWAPVVLDLDGDGVELVSFAASNVEFDMDGDGNRDRTGWFGADDGLLVLDANGNGIVDDGSEISFQRFVDGAFSDLEGLAFFDTNQNGLLDGSDERFGEFRIWQDRNQDGITDDGELLTLSELGIENISLTGTLTGDLPNANDNVVYATTSYQNSDGTSGIAGDTFFVFDPSSNLPDDEIPAPPDNQVPTPGEGDDGMVDDGSALEFGRQNFDRKSKKFRLASMEGNLFISPKKVRSVVDPRSGRLSPSMILNFTNRNIGLLSTIILDLDGDGLETRNGRKTDAWFDMDGNGVADDTGWAGRGDGYLVVDRNNNGIIDDGSELSFMSEVADARSGLQALASFDSNRDGIINQFDARFSELKIWVDRNENGRTDAGELGTLVDHGIASFSLAGQAINKRVKVGKNVLLATSIFTRTNGVTGTIGDAVLSFTPSTAPRPVNQNENNSRSLEDYTRRVGDFGLNVPVEGRFVEPELDIANLPELLALRAGLDQSSISLTSSGLDIRVPAGLDVFDHFEKVKDFDPAGRSLPDQSGDVLVTDAMFAKEPIAANDSAGDISEGSSEAPAIPPGISAGMLMSEYQGGPEQVDTDMLKIALMTQDMSSFGATSAAEAVRERKNMSAPLDYFAA